MRAEYYRIEGMMEVESTLKQAKVTAKKYVQELEKEDDTTLSNEELEDVYITGINKGETTSLTAIVRKKDGTVGFGRTFKVN